MANEATTKTAEAEAPKKVKPVLQTNFPTAEAAVAEADRRVKGPRRAFKCAHGNKTFFCVANNEGRAGGIAFMEIGGTVEELGKKVRAKKAIGIEGILAAINSLPEAERHVVMGQLKALSAKK